MGSQIEFIEEIPPYKMGVKISQVDNLRLRTPITLPIEKTEKYFVVKYDRWGIYLFVEKVEDLKKELVEYIQMLWKEYAMAPNHTLTKDALYVKQALNLDWEVIKE